MRSLSFKNNICYYIASVYLFKVSNGQTIKRFEICSKLTIATREGGQLRRSCDFVVNFAHVLLLF